MGDKTKKFWQYAAGRRPRRPQPRSDSDTDTDKSDGASVPAGEDKQKHRASKLARRAGKGHESRAKNLSYRNSCPDPRQSLLKEKYAWSEDWHRGYPYEYRRHKPAISAYSAGNTPNTEARLIRPASLPRMTHPRAPRDYWRDGIMMMTMLVKFGKSDDDSGYGSLADEDEDEDHDRSEAVFFYDPARDQISPPLHHGKVIVQPNPHFNVQWIYPGDDEKKDKRTKSKRTTNSGLLYQCRVVNGYKDGVVRMWAQYPFNEGGRIYVERHDDYRKKAKKMAEKL